MKIERDEGGAGTPRRRHEESSVVFSLASLRAMVEADALRKAPAQAGPMPSFSGTELGGIPSPPPQARRIAVAKPIASAPPSNLPFVMMLGLLLVTTIALGVYVVTTPRQQVVVTRVLAPAVDEVAPVAVPEPVVVAEPVAEVEPAEAPAVEVPAVEPARKTTPRTRTQPRERTQPRTVEPTPPKQPERKGDVPLECVLDPNLPSCGGKAPKSPPPSPPKTKVDPDLPETLSNTAIRNGMASVKGVAKTCGSKFGADAGEKVKVKLSIVGATGAVSSTTAEAPHHGTALGNCVAAALKKATFPHFRKSVIGVEYTITL